MSNEKNNNKEVVGKKVEDNNKSLLSLLDIEQEQIEAEKAFLSHDIVAKVSGYRISKDSEDRPFKVQIQTKMIDAENGSLIDETFTLSGAVKEADMKAIKGKFIKVVDVNRYQHIERNFQNVETGRTYTYGGDLENMSVVDGDTSELEPFSINSSCVITLDSVANVLKKGVPSGDVRLISIKENEDGSVNTFECKLKHTTFKYEKDQFNKAIGKTIKINFLKEVVIKGDLYRSTDVMPELV